jgi:hypothetical protein
MSDEYTKKMAALFIEKFNSKKVLSKTVNSPFDNFDGSTVFIPWYLKPFARKIREIARHNFTFGYYSNIKGASDTVAFKRPKEYASVAGAPSTQEMRNAIDELVPNNASLNDLVKSIASREGK